MFCSSTGLFLFSRCFSQLIVSLEVGTIFPRNAGLFKAESSFPGSSTSTLMISPINYPALDPPVFPPLLLFADDIKPQPSTPLVAKQKLSIVQTWSIHNGIKSNIRKSAVISNSITAPLLLSVGNEPLSLVSTYECLGTSFTNTGINFLSHISKTIQKTRKNFFSSSNHSRVWSPYVRLTILKTFHRPIFEYGFLHLFGFNTNARSVKLATLLKPVVSLQKMVLQ